MFLYFICLLLRGDAVQTEQGLFIRVELRVSRFADSALRGTD